MKRILVVEDNGQNMYLISFLLESHSYEITKATNGEGSISLATEETSDLILMDIKLPGIDDLEATRRIRQSEADGDIPIVALTSYAMPGGREKAFQTGCTGYIEKPIDSDTFIEEIGSFLECNNENSYC